MMSELKINRDDWQAPKIGEDIRFGDMPGDKVSITGDHIKKAQVIFPELLSKLEAFWKKTGESRAVIAVSGGSGVGKSEVASLLSYYFCQAGLGSYTLSGDNYPHRTPFYNDAERLRIFRQSGVRAMVAAGVFSGEHFAALQQLWRQDDDANADHAGRYPWFDTYRQGGLNGLKHYLGSAAEINFAELEEIIRAFKQGQPSIWLKRMGREETEFWYDEVDFRDIRILIIEWTHGNSSRYQGVDIAVLLNSTPRETLAHRQARNRDGKTDSAFTMAVLELEQEMLRKQAHKAAIIVSKQGGILSYEQYQQLMDGKGETHEPETR